MNKCLYCYDKLVNGEVDFHASCSRKFFGQSVPPVLPYAENDLKALAVELIHSRIAVTGVQAKLSVRISNKKTDDGGKRFTIVGWMGGFILKPPSPNYSQLPEAEDLTMHLAGLAKIKTVPHSLIRMASGNLAYVTRRIDRIKKSKLAMEDFCQLTERLTEDKYRGSYEQIAKAIQKYSATPGLDVVNFFEVVLFSFLTGNADMHLKNFSLIDQPGLGMVLSPAYDLVNTALVNPADDEELALNLNGKKKKFKRQDFVTAMNNSNVDDKQQQNIFRKMELAVPLWINKIDQSFLTEAFKQQFKVIIFERAGNIFKD